MEDISCLHLTNTLARGEIKEFLRVLALFGAS